MNHFVWLETPFVFGTLMKFMLLCVPFCTLTNPPPFPWKSCWATPGYLCYLILCSELLHDYLLSINDMHMFLDLGW